MPITNTKPVDRTSVGLRDALFDAMDDLRAGNATPQYCRAVGELGRAIGATMLIELEYQRGMKALATGGSALVASLPLGKLAA